MHMFLAFPQKVVEFGTAIFDPLSEVLDKIADTAPKLCFLSK